jgi:flagellar assembly factor FliW
MATAPSAPLLVDTIAGRFQVPAADVIHAADGLPGFEGCRRYVLVTAPEMAPFTCLHGLDAPAPSFVTIDPRLVVAGYQQPLGAAERARLGVEGDEPLLWLAVVRVAEDGATVNLRAPIVVHPGRMRALQLVGADAPYAAAHPLVE